MGPLNFFFLFFQRKKKSEIFQKTFIFSISIFLKFETTKVLLKAKNPTKSKTFIQRINYGPFTRFFFRRSALPFFLRKKMRKCAFKEKKGMRKSVF